MADNLEFELHVASDEHWENYKKAHGKQYHPDEEKERREHWEKQIHEVNAHNQEYKEGKHSWVKGINQFSDGTKPAMGYMKPKLAEAPQPE